VRGTPALEPAAVPMWLVHPRVCGEHNEGTYPGLPVVRFIPACAGNTRVGAAAASAVPVHPRVCGEHRALQAGAGSLAGSSPRVRGTLFSCLSRCVSLRFIPACAGNTRAALIEHTAKPVHPRVCGEHKRRPTAISSRNGSSPRVRGTRRWIHVAGGRRRFIPACAGNTC